MELSINQVIAMLQEGLAFPLRSIATALEQEFDKLNKQVNEMRSQLATEVLENGNLQRRIKCLEQKSIEDDDTINELHVLQAPISDVMGYELPLKDCDDPGCWCKQEAQSPLKECGCFDYGGCDKCRAEVIANLPPEEVGDEDIVEDDAICDCASCREESTGGCMADFDECPHSPGGATECPECRKAESDVVPDACSNPDCKECNLDSPCPSCGRWPDYDDSVPF
jgi:hypothetical protein